MFIKPSKCSFLLLFTLTQITACKSLFGNFGQKDSNYCDESTPCPSPKVCMANICEDGDSIGDGGTGDGGDPGNQDLAGTDLGPSNSNMGIDIFAPKMTGASPPVERIYRGKFKSSTLDSMVLASSTTGLSIYHATNGEFSLIDTETGISFPDSNAVGKASSTDMLDSFAQVKVSPPNSTVTLYRFFPGQPKATIKTALGTSDAKTKLDNMSRLTFARISNDKRELVITDQPGHFVVYRIETDGTLTPTATTLNTTMIDPGFTYQPYGIAAFNPNIMNENNYIITNFIKQPTIPPFTTTTQLITYKAQYNQALDSYSFTEVYRYDVPTFDKSTPDNILIGQFDEGSSSEDAAMIFGSTALHLIKNPISNAAQISVTFLTNQTTENQFSLMPIDPLKTQPDIVVAGGINSNIEQFTYQAGAYVPVSFSQYRASFGRYALGFSPYHIAGFFDKPDRPSLGIYHQAQAIGRPARVALAASHDQATPWVTRLAERVDLADKWSGYVEATPEGQLYYGPLSSNTSREILILPTSPSTSPVKAYTGSFTSIGTNNTLPMPATASSGKFYTCGANRAFGFVSQEVGIRNFNAAHISNGKLTFHSEGISLSAGEQVLDISTRRQTGTSQHQLVLLIGANTARMVRPYTLAANTSNPADSCTSQLITSINLGGGGNITNIINADMDGDGIDDYLWLSPSNVGFLKTDANGFPMGGATISPITLSQIAATGHGNFASKSQEQAVVLLADMTGRISTLRVINWNNNALSPLTTINLQYLYTQLVVEDLNGDGYSDLLLLGIDVGAVAVLPGGPSGLGQPILYQTGNGPLSLTVASPNVTVGGLRPDILTYHGGPTPHLFRLRNLSP